MSDPTLRVRIADAILGLGTVDACCAYMAADAVITDLGLRTERQTVDPDCPDGCPAIHLSRYLTDWTVDG